MLCVAEGSIIRRALCARHDRSRTRNSSCLLAACSARFRRFKQLQRMLAEKQGMNGLEVLSPTSLLLGGVPHRVRPLCRKRTLRLGGGSGGGAGSGGASCMLDTARLGKWLHH